MHLDEPLALFLPVAHGSRSRTGRMRRAGARRTRTRTRPSQGSWPMYGGTNQRNMANTTDKNIPESWNVGEEKKDWKNIKWAIDLGTESYGGPVIAGGKIYIGTNNGKPRDPKVEGDKGVLMCFRESDGKFLWQIVHDKLDDPNEYDNPMTGIVSAPVVEGDRLYYVSNRCEVGVRQRRGQDHLDARHAQGFEGFPAHRVHLFAADRRRFALRGHEQRRRISRRTRFRIPMRQASSRSTRRRARWCGRTIRRARTSWRANGAIRSPRRSRARRR